jgi:hypothetical protein
MTEPRYASSLAGELERVFVSWFNEPLARFLDE